MRADNSQHVIDAARQRSRDTHRRAVAALRRMDTTGQAITFEAVAREAGVSRSWLYNQTDLRVEINRLRQNRRTPKRPRIPDRQQPSDASLRVRLNMATQRIKNLEADNQALRAALAQALSDRRATR
jgi:AraC-like DNA-binding protein